MTALEPSQIKTEIMAMPSWLRRPIGKASELSTVQRIIRQRQIHTICEEGRCRIGVSVTPNKLLLFTYGAYLH